MRFTYAPIVDQHTRDAVFERMPPVPQSWVRASKPGCLTQRVPWVISLGVIPARTIVFILEFLRR